MFGSLDEDVRAFLASMGGDVDFVRLAVTREHVERLSLPTAPAKPTDRRAFSGDTVQAEAIPPDELARIVRGAIVDRLDGHILEAVLAAEEADALAASLHAACEAEGWRLSAPTPLRWYLHAPRAPDLATTPLDEVAGEYIAPPTPTMA